MGGNTQMYYLNGRIDYRGLSPKDVNTELYTARQCTQLHKQGFHTKYVKNFAKKNKPRFCKQKVRCPKEERSLIGGCALAVTGGK